MFYINKIAKHFAECTPEVFIAFQSNKKGIYMQCVSMKTQFTTTLCDATLDVNWQFSSQCLTWKD